MASKKIGIWVGRYDSIKRESLVTSYINVISVRISNWYYKLLLTSWQRDSNRETNE